MFLMLILNTADLAVRKTSVDDFVIYLDSFKSQLNILTISYIYAFCAKLLPEIQGLIIRPSWPICHLKGPYILARRIETQKRALCPKYQGSGLSLIALNWNFNPSLYKSSTFSDVNYTLIKENTNLSYNNKMLLLWLNTITYLVTA